MPGGPDCPSMDSGFKPGLSWQSSVFGMSGEVNTVHRGCPGVEVGGIIHKAMFERPLICEVACRPNALGGQ